MKPRVMSLVVFNRLRTSSPFTHSSAPPFVECEIGVSDGWQDFAANGAMTWTYTQAGPGNVALLGELNRRQVVLALVFGNDREAAATLAISALLKPFEAA